MTNSVLLQVITPEQLIYKGEVEMVIVKTTDGYEGFMANHSHALVLLEEGEIKLRETGKKDFRILKASGGYMDVKDEFVIFLDDAQWGA